MVSRPTSCPSRVTRRWTAPASRRALLGDQVGQAPVLAGCEHRRRGAVLDLDQGQAGDGLEVPGRGDPHGDGGRAAPRRGRLDAVGAAASESEVRQRLGKAGQHGVQKVVAPHAAGDQRRREVRECGGEDSGRIGQVRVDGEPFGQQESIPAHSRVLSRCRGHDRGSAPVAHHHQAEMAAVAQALQRSHAEIGTVKGGRQLRPYPAGSGLLASDQCTSALHGGPVQSLDNQHHHALR